MSEGPRKYTPREAVRIVLKRWGGRRPARAPGGWDAFHEEVEEIYGASLHRRTIERHVKEIEKKKEMETETPPGWWQDVVIDGGEF